MPCPTITTIQPTECIGNSLAAINNNFNNLKTAICDTQLGISVQDEGNTLGTGINMLNFTGKGVNAINSGNITTVNIPGPEEKLLVSKLEEQGLNSGGGQNNFFILNNGSLRVTGVNTLGELGIGRDGVSRIPRISAFNPPLEVNEGISKLYTQGQVTFVITTNGRLYGAGQNNQAQLGLGHLANPVRVFTRINVTGDLSVTPADPIVQIATGTSAISTNITVFARTASGRLFVWGNNRFGQAGIGAAGRGAAANILTPQPVFGNGTVKYVASGGSNGATTTFVVDSNDKLWVTGRNQDGQAGIGNSVPANITTFLPSFGFPANYKINKIRVGGRADNITCWVTLQDGTLWAAGFNNVGQASGSTSVTILKNFTRVNGFSDSDFVEDVVAHADSGVTTVWALIRDGDAYRLKGWGTDSEGCLGLNSVAKKRVPVDNSTWPWLTTGAKVKQVVVAGDNAHKTTLVLDTNNILWAAGSNYTGLLGVGELRTTRAFNDQFRRVLFNPALGVPVEIRSTNNDSTFANFLVLLNTGLVLGWGYNNGLSNQLGVDPDYQIAYVTIPSIVQIVI